MFRPALIVLVCLAGAGSAAAQTWSRHDGYGGDGAYGYGDRSAGVGWNAAPSTFDWRSQLDRPGDYRCDAYWDAGRTDCGAGWRDQRRGVSPQARQDYRELAGYGRHDGYSRGYGYGYGGRGYGFDRHGYGRYGYDGYGYDRYGSYGGGHGSAYAYTHGAGGTTYRGAYGRPDHVYPGSGRGGVWRDPDRIAWCRGTYRSYDPGSGYYRAWSGRLVWCG